MNILDEIYSNINIGRISNIFSGVLTRKTNMNTTSSISAGAGVYNLFQDQAINSQLLSSLYGADFEARYRSFERAYFDAISDSSNVRRGAKFDVESMRMQGRMDLTLLNYTERKALESRYLNEVLDLQNLFNQAGLPRMQMPSANPFRKSFRYFMDQSEIALGNVSPIAALLNRLTFNMDPLKPSMDAVSVGAQDIMTYDRLTRTAGQFGTLDDIMAAGKKIGIFDVETTGVFAGAQIRSMAISDIGIVNPKDVTSYAYRSPQLSGLLVSTYNEGLIKYNDYIAKVEGTESVMKDMGPAGRQFLDEATEYINQLLTYDTISAHNASFDIRMLTQTMQDMPGFAKHAKARTALKTLYERINSTPGYLVDTLELSRNYMLRLVQDGLQVDETSKFINRLYAPELLGRIHMGGGSGYATVENIALNTNLTELVLRDSPNLLQGAAHQAAYDTVLQGQILKYMQNGQLQLRSPDLGANLGITDGNQLTNVLEQAAKVRMNIFRASAITPTTNISDPRYISDVTFNYLQTDKGMTRISLNLLEDDIQRLGINNVTSGILSSFETDTGDISFRLHHVIGTDFGYTDITDDTTARSLVRSILDQARQGTESSLNKVISLGMNQYAESAAMEMNALKNATASISQQMTDETVFNALTSVHTGFAQRQLQGFLGSVFKPLGTAGSFLGGVRDYTLSESEDIARSMASIGSPYDFMDIRSRIFSTAVSEATADTAENIYNSLLAANESVDDLMFTAYAKQLSSQGISYWNAQSKARMTDATAGLVSKVILPTDIAEEALSRMPTVGSQISNLSMSVTSDDTVNLVWNINRQFTRSESEELAFNIFEVMRDRYASIKNDAKALDEMDASVLAEMQNIQKAYNQPGVDIRSTDLFMEFSETLRERGAVIGSLNDKMSQTVIDSLKALRIPIGGQDTDVILGSWSARMLKSVDGRMILSPFLQEQAAEIAGLADETGQGAIDALNKISQYLRDSSDPGSSSTLLDDIGRTIDTAGDSGFSKSALDLYRSSKIGIKGGMLGLSAAIVGYYAASKYQERQLVNETVEQQPYEAKSYNNPNFQYYQSQNRMDPLLTAGVVGSLDRSKMGHHMMGPGKNNHLFGY